MPGYSKLSDAAFPLLFKETEGTVETKVSPLNLTLEIRDKVVIVCDSIPVRSLTAFIDYLATREDLTDKHILLGVEGQGVTEQHIVTMHLPPNAQPIVYDSKYGDAERFFSLPASPNTIGNKILSALATLNPFTSSERHIDLSHLNSERIKSATYHAFGTQSFFDGVTCGYHTGRHIKTLANFLEDGKNPTPQQLLDASESPVTSSAKVLKVRNLDRVNMSFFAFLKKAWQDTFMPLVDKDLKDSYHFGHYFMGWPSDPKGSKMAYFLTLKFITAPLTNLLSLVIEFPLNVLSEAASFLKNIVLSWAPTSGITQGIRSLLLLATIGLQELFKGAYYLIRIVTSPRVSFKEAQSVHPALGYLSAIASVCIIGGAIAALAIFAPPIVAALIPSMGPGALSILAYPFVQLFSLRSLSIPAATAAMLTLATGGVFLGVLHLLGRKTIYPNESQSNKHNQESSDQDSTLKDMDEDLFEDPPEKSYEKDPHVTGPSDMLNEHFGKKPSTKKNTKKSTEESPEESLDNDFNPNDNQVTIGT